jgi:hypothetical protein
MSQMGRTSVLSQKCQQATFWRALFDHLVGAGEHRRRIKQPLLTTPQHA